MGMISLPNNKDDCMKAITALGIFLQIDGIRLLPSHRTTEWHHDTTPLGIASGMRRKANGRLEELQSAKNILMMMAKKLASPPNFYVQQFSDHEIPSLDYSRGGYDDTLP